ncbi:unnamed protein product, partial [marine sediment metagenome]
MKKTWIIAIVIAILLVVVGVSCWYLSEKSYLYPHEVFYKERNGEYKDGDAVKVIYGYAEIEATNIDSITVIVLYEDATKTSAPLPVYILKNDPYGTENLINQYFLSADFGVT